MLFDVIDEDLSPEWDDGQDLNARRQSIKGDGFELLDGWRSQLLHKHARWYLCLV
jgi:hypothetical protein